MKVAVMMKFALWFSVVATFAASLLLGLVGIGIWLVFWVVFWLIFRNRKPKAKTPEQQAASDARWMRVAEKIDGVDVSQMKEETARMKADRKRVAAVRKADGWHAAEDLRKQQNADRREARRNAE